MGKGIALLSFLLTGCATSLHLVYIDGDRGVYAGPERTECMKSFSSWDGKDWSDYYAAPCNVYVKRHVRKLKDESERQAPKSTGL